VSEINQIKLLDNRLAEIQFIIEKQIKREKWKRRMDIFWSILGFSVAMYFIIQVWLGYISTPPPGKIYEAKQSLHTLDNAEIISKKT